MGEGGVKQMATPIIYAEVAHGMPTENRVGARTPGKRWRGGL